MWEALCEENAAQLDTFITWAGGKEGFLEKLSELGKLQTRHHELIKEHGPKKALEILCKECGYEDLLDQGQTLTE
jgi:hypothetical protein